MHAARSVSSICRIFSHFQSHSSNRTYPGAMTFATSDCLSLGSRKRLELAGMRHHAGTMESFRE